MNKRTYHIFFGRLSNPLRIDIISSLDEKPKSVMQLCKEIDAEQSKLSHALRELRECNIIKFEQKGKKRIYSLNKTIKPILNLIEKHVKQQCNYKNCKLCKINFN